MSDLINGADNAPWMRVGLCVKGNPENWFPSSAHEERAATELCKGCPSKTPCLEYALADSTLDGIWGGTTPGQRAWLRRKARDNDAA